jgi:hypothetical protein
MISILYYKRPLKGVEGCNATYVMRNNEPYAYDWVKSEAKTVLCEVPTEQRARAGAREVGPGVAGARCMVGVGRQGGAGSGRKDCGVHLHLDTRLRNFCPRYLPRYVIVPWGPWGRQRNSVQRGSACIKLIIICTTVSAAAGSQPPPKTSAGARRYEMLGAVGGPAAGTHCSSKHWMRCRRRRLYYFVSQRKQLLLQSAWHAFFSMSQAGWRNLLIGHVYA